MKTPKEIEEMLAENDKQVKAAIKAVSEYTAEHGLTSSTEQKPTRTKFGKMNYSNFRG